jgi:hypothetical protein
VEAVVVKLTSFPYAVPALLVAYARTKYRVLAERLKRLLVNLPAPEPLLVLVVSAVVGFWLVLQHTPLAVTALPPSALIFPPLVAAVLIITVAADVLREGKPATELPRLLDSFLQEKSAIKNTRSKKE